ncbi:hypothetical protein [Rubripirellula reticaptiva]|nr:hypothetical protein [Rubripirellula reticaptiva]
MFDREAMKQRIQAARDQWRGCEWQTSFGPQKLDLAGIRRRQAILAAKATRGEESVGWFQAVQWLGEVERDAVQAAEFADRAFAEAERNCWTEASDLLSQAEALEAKYSQLDGYQQVREAFQGWFAGTRNPAEIRQDV